MPSPARMTSPAMSMSSSGHAALAVLDDAEVAQQFLDGVGDDLGIVGVAQDGQLVGVFQQREHPEPDHVRGGLVPGDQQPGAQLRGLLDAELAGLDPLGQVGHRVFGRVLHLGLDQLGEVLVQAHRAFDGVLAGRIAREPDVGVVLEHLGVFVRHAQQLADHQRRHRQCQRGDEVGGLRPGQHRVDVVVGDLLDGRPQTFDSLEGERLRQHPPESGVLFAIGGEDRSRTLVHRGQHALVPVRKAGPPVVDADPGIGEQLAHLLVAGDEPRRAAVPDPDSATAAWLRPVP